MQEQVAQLAKAVQALTEFNRELAAKLATFSAPVVADAKVDLTLVHAKLDKIGEMVADFMDTNGIKTDDVQHLNNDEPKKSAKTK